MLPFFAVFKREAAPHDHLRRQSFNRGGERGQAWGGIVCICWQSWLDMGGEQTAGGVCVSSKRCLLLSH